MPGGNVLTPPKPTLAKTYQTGSVLKFNRLTLDMDAYYVHFQNGYDSYTDPTTGEPVFVATGPSNTKGIEAESNIALGYGFSLYGNLSFGSAKYQTGANYPERRRVGGQYAEQRRRHQPALAAQELGHGSGVQAGGTVLQRQRQSELPINGVSIPYPVDQAITINPFNLVNVFLNYTIKNTSYLRGTKIQLAINNLANSHNLVGITPGVAATCHDALCAESGSIS